MIDAINALMGNFSPSLFGMNIMTSALVRPVPRIQLSPEFNCSDSVRTDMNAWLLEMFGTKEVMYRMGDDTLVLSYDTLKKVKQSMFEKGLL